MSAINPNNQDNRRDDSDELIFAPESDELIFAPENNEVGFVNEVKDNEKLDVDAPEKYKLLVVDDEPEIHNITRLLLNDFTFEGKKLELMSAFSGKEAEEVIQKNSDIALILLDVIMETDDAGLNFVKYVREVLNNHLVRIVLRTGQPGTVPEDTIVEKYDIDDFKSKTELTKIRLFTTVRTTLRVYNTLNRIYKINSKLEIEIKYSQEVEKALKFKSTQLEYIIKELKNTQLQLVQNEKMSALGQLIAGVAHEINNPIGFISGNLQFINDYFEDILNLIKIYQNEYPNPVEKVQNEINEIDFDYLRDDIQELISSMQEGANRLYEISRSLTTFSREDVNNKISYDIHQGLDSTILILKHRLKGNLDRPEIKIIKEYNQILMIECYPGQLNQVFMNLLTNAIDALEESNKGLSYEEIVQKNNFIKITTAAEENNIIIKIADNGIGMSPETLQQVFDYLFTTKPVGKGTGIGLSICRQIIEDKHHGKLLCHSEIGKGTTFIIEIPN